MYIITIIFAEETGSVPGVPGRDYPVYSRPPKTNFACVKGHGGYYADVSTRCQVSVMQLTLSVLCAFEVRNIRSYRVSFSLCP